MKRPSAQASPEFRLNGAGLWAYTAEDMVARGRATFAIEAEVGDPPGFHPAPGAK